jgi:hypothetical protein
MFSSTVLDLAIGLVFCFLTVSLTTGTVVETISSMIKWRSKTLLSGIQQLLNDTDMTGLAGKLYAHAAINPLGPGVGNPKSNMPAYIDRQLFAKAMMDITGISFQVAAAAGGAGDSAAARPSLAALHNQVDTALKAIPNQQIQQFLTGIIDRSYGDAEKMKTELSEWFDHAMDRVSGVYKRWTQWVGFVVALLLAAAFNIDAIGVARTLWEQPAVAETFKANKELKAADAIEQLNKAIPIGWPNGFGKKVTVQHSADGKTSSKIEAFDSLFSGPDWWLALLGWVITALTTLFGAPFWFDLLQTLIRLKGTGPSPKEKVEGKGAAA